jgi:HEAT repeat protein
MHVSELLKKLSSGDDRQAEAAVSDFVAQGTSIVPSLGDLLSAPDPDLRWWATRALAEVDDPRVPALLRSALYDADVTVRQCAALALRRQPYSQAIADLIALLDDEDRLLARLAADALVAAGEGAVPAVLEVMQTGSQKARLEAVRVLALTGDQRSIATLFAALDDPSSLIEYWADEGLERMGIGMVFYKPGG